MSNTFRWSDELYHHGILGMKWGIRRYQNPDGSLTEAGRRRYGAGKGIGRYKDTTPAQLGYTPNKGKRGDIVQRTLAKETYRNIKKFEKNAVKAAEQLKKYNGVESKKSGKYFKKANKFVEQALFEIDKQKVYANMAESDKKSIRRSYMIGKFISGVLGGAIYGTADARLGVEAIENRKRAMQQG